MNTVIFILDMDERYNSIKFLYRLEEELWMHVHLKLSAHLPVIFNVYNNDNKALASGDNTNVYTRYKP